MSKKYPGFRNYAYLFAHILPANAEDYGTEYDPAVQMAYHSSELFYAFASLRENVPPTRAWKDADYGLADQMSSYWANFIRCGNPCGDKVGSIGDSDGRDCDSAGNCGALPAWKDSADGSFMEFTDRPVGHKGFDSVLDPAVSAFVQEKYFDI